MIHTLGRLLKKGYFFPRLRFWILYFCLLVLNSRGEELEFVLSNLPKLKAIDIGASLSLLIYELNARGYETYALDQNDYQEKVRGNIKFIKHDITKPLPAEYDNFFDIVTCVSAFEHIGRGEFGDEKNFNGYALASENIARILKKEGVLLITVPEVYGFTVDFLISIFHNFTLVKSVIKKGQILCLFIKK